MNIKLLGAKGCQVCQRLEQDVFDVLSELQVAAAVDKIEDVDRILQYDVFSLPGVVINGQVKISGRAPSKSELRTWIKELI